MAPSDYERALVPLESAQGQALAAALADALLPRMCAASEAFESQQEGSWCGLAAICTALKALASLEPNLLSADAASALSQECLFGIEQEARRAPPSSRQLAAGLSLAEGELLLADLGLPMLRSRRQPADDPTFAETLAMDLSSTRNQIMLVNVLRQVGGVWTGHWMTCAASVHSRGECWVLVLDPAAHKLGPHWLPEGMLLSTMATRNVRGEARGYLVLSLEAGCAPATAPPPKSANSGTAEFTMV